MSGGGSWTTRHLGMTSTVVAPVSLSGRVWGAISIWVNEGRLPDETEERIARFTSLVSTALANAEAREELLASLTERKQREDEQAALRRVAVAVASEQRPDDVFQTVAEEVGRLFGGSNTHLVRFEGENHAVVLGGWVDGQIDAEIVGRRIGLYGEGPISHVREAGRR